MKLKPRDFLFIAIVIVVVGGLYLLSTRGRIPTPSTRIPEHQTAKSRDDCMKCHTPEKMDALEGQRKHPLKWRDARINCTECHKPPAAKAQSALVSTP